MPAERKVTVLFPTNNGSLFLFIFQFSDIMDYRDDGESKEHAYRVMTVAKYFLNELNRENTFKPSVLARVSYGGRFFVGASIAVSHFLRPICLFHRIINFKQSLGEAVVHFKPLNLPDPKNWSFEAFCKNPYIKKREPCQNCQTMFFNDGSGDGCSSFLAACAEYCPVNQLLPDEPYLWQSAKVDKHLMDLLKRNFDRCSYLFKNFLDISNKCMVAAQSKNKELMKTVYWDVIYKLHIFGLDPECNPYF